MAVIPQPRELITELGDRVLGEYIMREIGVYLPNVIGYKEDSRKYVNNYTMTKAKDNSYTYHFRNRFNEDLFTHTFSTNKGIVFDGNTFGHANNVTANTAGSKTDENMDSDGYYTTPWITYDVHGHITNIGTRRLKFPIIDEVPVNGSRNLVRSSGIYTKMYEADQASIHGFKLYDNNHTIKYVLGNGNEYTITNDHVKVTSIPDNSARVYLTGTRGTTRNIADQYYNTGVYLGTSAGTLYGTAELGIGPDSGRYYLVNSTGSTTTVPVSMTKTLGVTGATTLNNTLHTVGVATFDNNVSVGGTFTVTGASTLNDTLTVAKATTLKSTLGVTGATTLSSTLHTVGVATFDSNITIGGTLGVTGATTLSNTLTTNGAATFKSTLGVTGATTLSNTLTVNGATTLKSTLGVTGNTTIGGTLGVTGASTFNDVVTLKKNMTTAADIILQRTTVGSNDYGANNPSIHFKDSDGSQVISLIYTDYDAVISPASLTLIGNQGGEYFIAPNIKATASLTAGTTLNVGGAATLKSTLGVTGNTTIGGTLGVTGATTLSNTLTTNGATTLKSTLGVTGATTLSSTLTVNGATTLKSTLGVTGNTTIGGTLGVTGIATFNNTTEAGSSSSAGVVMKGGLGVAKQIVTDGKLFVGHATAANAIIYLNSKSAIKGSDSWLRINEDKAFTSGTYFGNGIIRTDGTFQVGDNGSAAVIDTASATFNNLTTINNTLNLNRRGSTSYGRIAFYASDYKTWYSYMSDRAAATCPTGGTPSGYGNVTTWAQRSLIQNNNGYGWILESCAETANANPTPMMAVSSYNGDMFNRGNHTFANGKISLQYDSTNECLNFVFA